jgi:hypothetical protein
MNEQHFITNEIAKAIRKRGFISKIESEKINNYLILRKVALYDVDGSEESIWIGILTENDCKLFDSGEEVKVILLNHAVCFYPNYTWGRIIKVKNKKAYRNEQISEFKRTENSYHKEYKPEIESE